MADNQGSFVTGLTIGLFAGAASYFLLGTQKGKKLRDQLEKEWQAAQAAGVTQGTVPGQSPNVISLRSFFDTLKQSIAQAAEEASPHTASSTRKSRKQTVKKADPRFKGV